MTAADLIHAFETLADAPGGVARLRELVLQLAVRGKLVAQDPGDEPAAKLLERIRAEKARLVKAGEIRAPKPLPAVGEGERPFEVPEGWEWVRLADAYLLEMGQSPSSEFYNQSGDGLPFYQGKADFGDLHPSARYWCTEPTKYAQDGDILLSVRAPVGPTNIAVETCCIGRGLAGLRACGGASNSYLLWMLRAFERAIATMGSGTTFVAITKRDLEPLPLPLPPLAEQHRIVARVDELMSLLDGLEAAQAARDKTRTALRDATLAALRDAEDVEAVQLAWARVAEHLDTLFTDPEDVGPLRQTILQLAVRGRLVAQDPGDEPAARLLERIKAEKAALVKAGKIRAGKEVAPVSAEEVPFEVPGGWEWVRLDNILEDGLTNGWSPQAVEYATDVKTLKLSATTSGQFDGSKIKYLDVERKAVQRYWLKTGDLLIQRSNTKEYVGMAALFPGPDEEYVFPDLMMKGRPVERVSSLYVHRYLTAPTARTWFGDHASGTSKSMIKLSQGAVLQAMIPLPPSPNSTASSPRSTSSWPSATPWRPASPPRGMPGLPLLRPRCITWMFESARLRADP